MKKVDSSGDLIVGELLEDAPPKKRRRVKQTSSWMSGCQGKPKRKA